MFVSESLDVNEHGHLTIGGCDTVELAKEYGTPLYVMDENKIRTTCRMYKQSFEKYYGGHGLPIYASKAFCCKEICRIVNEEGLGLDVVSQGEIYTAVKAGFPAEKIHFHGNNKTAEEIRLALSDGVGRFVVDNMEELSLVNHLAGEAGKKVNAILRIKPGVDAHTHDFIKTGQIDSKFGFALENGEAMHAAKACITLPNIVLKGFHCHIGSQIFDIDPFVFAADVMLGFIKAFKDEAGLEVEELNLGGGFGIKYLESDNPVAYDSYMKEVSASIHKRAQELGLSIPFIFIEPGRSIVGEAGITLYEVGSVKTIEGIRTYVSVDGGMGDNPRYALYQAPYTIVTANKANDPKTMVATVAGRCCESGDLIQENAEIQQTIAGDILAVLSTGAYNYSMASNYNRVPRPAIVMIKDGVPRVIVKRESLDDLIANDL